MAFRERLKGKGTRNGNKDTKRHKKISAPFLSFIIFFVYFKFKNIAWKTVFFFCVCCLWCLLLRKCGLMPFGCHKYVRRGEYQEVRDEDPVGYSTQLAFGPLS